MANRITNPDIQFLDSAGNAYAGGKLFFYITGTTTKTNTYSDNLLATPNANPVILDGAGRAGNIFLDSSTTYKMVLAASTDTDPPSNPIISADPVVDLAANATSAITVYAGDPNGNLSGNQGAQGGAGASAAWDSVNHRLFICTATGSAATAVWTSVASTLSGAITFSTTVSPTILAADANNYSPTSLNSAYTLRLSASTAVNITGLDASGSTDGRTLVLVNVGSFNITLNNQNASSTAANRFLFNTDLILKPNIAVVISYDQTTVRWRFAAGPAGNVTLTDVEDQGPITGGASVTSKSLGTFTTGTATVDVAARALQHYTNGGAHALAPGSNPGACLVDITNNGSAGAISTAGFTKVSGSFDTTNGHIFRCHISKGNGGSLLVIQAMQ